MTHLLILLAAMAAASSGCAQLNDPTKDAGAASRAEMTTASAEGFRDKAEFGRPLHRNWPAIQLQQENGVVTHWPLWFEDPFEDKGNRSTQTDDPDAPDNDFAVTWMDGLHLAYGPGRMFVNTVAWPASAVVTLPGRLMESDGRISEGLLWHDLDAQRSEPGAREPPDEAAIERAITEPEPL